MRQFQTDHKKGGVGLHFYQTHHDFAVLPMSIQNRLWVVGIQYQIVVAKLESDKALPEKKELNAQCQRLIDDSSSELATLRRTYDPAFEDPESCSLEEMEYNWLMQCCYGKIYRAALITGMLERSFSEEEVAVE